MNRGFLSVSSVLLLLGGVDFSLFHIFLSRGNFLFGLGMRFCVGLLGFGICLGIRCLFLSLGLGDFFFSFGFGLFHFRVRFYFGFGSRCRSSRGGSGSRCLSKGSASEQGGIESSDQF